LRQPWEENVYIDTTPKVLANAFSVLFIKFLLPRVAATLGSNSPTPSAFCSKVRGGLVVLSSRHF
jgi:hypothetical protein